MLLIFKLLFRAGNTKLTIKDFNLIFSHCGFKSKRTLRNHITKLESLDWIWYNPRHKQYNVRSSINILYKNGLKNKPSVDFKLKYCSSFNGFSGGIIFSFSNYIFWKYKLKSTTSTEEFKVGGVTHYLLPKRKGCVVKIGATDRLFPLSYFKGEYSPAALRGVSKISGVNISKINKYKTFAINTGYLKFKKDFELIPVNNSTQMKMFLKTTEDHNDFVLKHNQKFYLRKSDLVKPLIVL